MINEEIQSTPSETVTDSPVKILVLTILSGVFSYIVPPAGFVLAFITFRKSGRILQLVPEGSRFYWMYTLGKKLGKVSLFMSLVMTLVYIIYIIVAAIMLFFNLLSFAEFFYY